MEKYSIKEELRSVNKLQCTKCNRLEDAEKKLEFLEGPKLLVTQLKRYAKDKVESTGVGALPISVKTTKLKQHVTFHREMELKRNNMQGWVSNTESYSLRGFIVHYGEETSEGHYKVFVNRNGNWTEWDDETGSPVLWKDIRTEEAYVLFWEKKDRDVLNKSPHEIKVVTDEDKKVRKDEEEESLNAQLANVEKEMDLDPESTKRKIEKEAPNRRAGTNKSKDGERDKKRVKRSNCNAQVLQDKPETDATPKTKEDEPAATSNLDLAAIKAIIADLRGKVEKLEEKVRVLTIDNTDLRGRVQAIRRICKLRFVLLMIS